MVFLIAQEAFKVVAYIYQAEAFKGLAYNSYINQAMKALRDIKRRTRRSQFSLRKEYYHPPGNLSLLNVR